MSHSVKSVVAGRAKRVVARLIACNALLALPACAIPALMRPESGPKMPDYYGDVVSSENTAQVRAADFFNDPALTALIDQAIAGNQELKILAQDVEIANNEILLRQGAYLPFVTLGADAGVERASKYTRNGAVEDQLRLPRDRRFPDPLPNFMVAANFSWEVDIWGRLRNLRDAAALRYLATAEGRNYTVTRLTADVAENYYELLALDKRMETLDKTIALQEQSLKLAEARKAAGRDTELPVQRFQADVRKNQSEKLVVAQEIVEAENRINLLLGRYPQPVERSAANFLDMNGQTLSVGLPAQLLLNRPDVRRAERELAAAGLEVEAARAEFLPRLDISGGVGYEAFNPKYLFRPDALVANAAGGLVAPLVNTTAIRAAYLTANARQLQALYDYQRTVLTAFTEVVNSVSRAENYRKSIELRKLQLQALEASVDSATKLFQNARAEYTDVLFSQRDLMDARMDLIEAKRRQLSAIANAYQALGGGGPPVRALSPTPAQALPAPAPAKKDEPGAPPADGGAPVAPPKE